MVRHIGYILVPAQEHRFDSQLRPPGELGWGETLSLVAVTPAHWWEKTNPIAIHHLFGILEHDQAPTHPLRMFGWSISVYLSR